MAKYAVRALDGLWLECTYATLTRTKRQRGLFRDRKQAHRWARAVGGTVIRIGPRVQVASGKEDSTPAVDMIPMPKVVVRKIEALGGPFWAVYVSGHCVDYFSSERGAKRHAESWRNSLRGKTITGKTE